MSGIRTAQTGTVDSLPIHKGDRQPSANISNLEGRHYRGPGRYETNIWALRPADAACAHLCVCVVHMLGGKQRVS